ncbi:MAG: ADP-glyceromanno-heptose 6-epimerase [Flavobacteriales bacterium]|nr:MAG: ADP-glyceromanno-heptose 6-epimerase [Flavobacteriales bacterium]
MIVITGAAGFIASFLAQELNKVGKTDLVLVDDFSIKDKESNHKSIQCHSRIERNAFIDWFSRKYDEIEFVFHLGARTDTTEMDYSIHEELNLEYSKSIWNICSNHKIPLIYASSAATYGLGENGYSDNHDLVYKLKPLNPYGDSKNNFDKWALQEEVNPPFWAGLKFFNVYGPNESHKGRMASVIYHAFHQIKSTGKMNLFRSHNSKYKDGEQLRDFIYVKDVIKICLFLYKNQYHSGLFNVGTGKAETFKALVENTFEALNMGCQINYIDTPEDIRDNYQYFTEADMNKLESVGYHEPFFSLKEGVHDYIQHYLNR